MSEFDSPVWTTDEEEAWFRQQEREIMAKNKVSNPKPANCDGDGDCSCCITISDLALAANAIRRHASCCLDEEGTECCRKSLDNVLEALQAHVDHLKTSCC